MNNKNSSERSKLLDIDENAFRNLRITAKEKQVLLDKLENESLFRFIIVH